MLDPQQYTNPVIRGFHPDPSICRVGDDFYLVVSSFEYFPAIPIFHSTDLVTWEQIGHVLDRPEQIDLTTAPASGGIFAPTIRYHEGVFYVTGTNVSFPGHFIVQTTDPRGAWSDPVWVDQNGIDPSLFFEDGRAYFSSNIEPDPSGPHLEFPSFERGIQQSVVDPATGAILEPPRMIWGGTGGRYPEGPHLYRRGDYYYLLISEGGTEYGHMATVGRSTSPWGPFEASPYGPLLRHAGMPTPFYGVGHADMIDIGDDEWWLVCLGTRPTGQWPRHHLGRETLLAPVSWTSDGWPQVGDNAIVPTTANRPQLAPMPAQENRIRQGFGVDSLAAEWQTVRRPLSKQELRLNDGKLSLSSTRGLHAEPHPVFAGRRQADHRFVARTEVALATLKGESGITVRMNDNHYFALGVARSADKWEVVTTQSQGGEPITSRWGELDESTDVVLSVEGGPDHYVFVIEQSDRRHVIGKFDARLLSTEFAGGFTGVFVGPYAAGTPEEPASADFAWFDYVSLDADSSGGPEGLGSHNETTAPTHRVEPTTHVREYQ